MLICWWIVRGTELKIWHCSPVHFCCCIFRRLHSSWSCRTLWDRPRPDGMWTPVVFSWWYEWSYMGLGCSSNPSQSMAGACQLPQNFDHRMPKIVHRRCVSAEKLSPFAAYTADANVGQTWLNLAAALTKSCEAAPVKTAEQLDGCGYSGTKNGTRVLVVVKMCAKVG